MNNDHEKERTIEILNRLKQHCPGAHCTLDHQSPFQLLIATILSAQCTDERVNKISPALFEQFPNAKSFATAPRSEVEESIRSTGFFRNKAKSIQQACEAIEREYKGNVPDTMEELIRLPGIGRKTANVILGTAFHKNEGVVVDTHVQRVANRLGLASAKEPQKTEKQLMYKIPQEEWTIFSHEIIDHGRKICKAKNPQCERCFLQDLCPFAQAVLNKTKDETA